MKVFKFSIYLFSLLLFLQCGEQGDTVVGSKDHSVAIEKSLVPSVLADGVSSIQIAALVLDDSGRVASNMKVAFSTTAGTISESAISDDYGIAIATLTSVASQTDLDATVTATVVDPTFSSLGKSRLHSVSVAVPGYEKSGLSKKSDGNTDSIVIRFLGISLTSTLKDSIMPADGLSQTMLNVNVLETTSRKPVIGAQLLFSSRLSKIDNSAITDEQGKASMAITAAEIVGRDTVTVRLGSDLNSSQTIEYVQPILKLSANSQSLLADGKSQTEIVAAVLTHKNTPVVGATVEFTTSDGRIQASAVTDQLGNATAILVAGESPNPAVMVQATFLSVKDSIQVAFINASGSMMTVASDVEKLYRDGQSEAQIQLAFVGDNPADFANRLVYISADYGTVPDSVLTDANGAAQFIFKSDAGTDDVTATIQASFGAAQSTAEIALIGLDVRVTASPDSLAADGVSESVITVSLRQAGSKIPISEYNVEFGASDGTIERSGVTNAEGVVQKTYKSGTVPGDVSLYVYVGQLILEKRLTLYRNYPSNLVLSTENSYIWVKETGEIEQTNLTAQLLGATGKPVSDPYKVTFNIIQGPGGGEQLVTPEGYAAQTVTVSSVDGTATVRLLSGIRSGAVLVRADLADYPQVGAQASRIVIRSGPPYMWVDPNDTDNVIQKGTIIVPPGQHNVGFANPVQEIPVTVYFGDKYNNPVEKGTAVYFTTTGGFISSDASTDELGRASVILQNVNPFPVLHSTDPNQHTATNFPDPNGDGSTFLNIRTPDFEGGVITNTLGNTNDNDGVATIIAITNGKDQNGNDIKVWTYAHVVFSVGIHTFHVWADRYTIAPGQAATIYIEVWDMNGNPVAAGSQLSVTTDAGSITASELMPSAERYGWGSTFFSTQLVNTLDPENDEPKMATVEISLTSPNGDRSASLGINLTL